MQVYRRLQDSLIFIQDEGLFSQVGFTCAASGPDDVTGSSNGDEIFLEPWADILDIDGNPAGTTQQEVLDYLDEQKIPVRVAAVWNNLDTTTNLNTTAGNFQDQLVPLVANEGKASDLFTRIDDNIFQCDFFGEIVINCNIYMQSAGARVAMEARIIRDPNGNNSVEGPVAASGYIRNSNGHNRSSLNWQHFAGVGVGTQFAVGIRRESTVTADVTLATIQTSHIQVLRVR